MKIFKVASTDAPNEQTPSESIDLEALFSQFKTNVIIEDVDDEEDPDADADDDDVVAKIKKEKYIDREFNKLGRKSSKELKNKAFDEPFMEAAAQLRLPCNSKCTMGRSCLKGLTIDEIVDLRVELWNDIGCPAPADKERGARFLELLKKARMDEDGNLIFQLESKKNLCEGAILRILGLLTSSVNPSDAPTLWTRLKKEMKEGNSGELLSDAKLKLDASETFSWLKGQAKAYILEICQEYSDVFATVTSTGIVIN